MLTYLPYVTLGSIAPLLFEDLRVSATYWRNARGGPQDAETKRLLKEGGVGGHATLVWRDLSM